MDDVRRKSIDDRLVENDDGTIIARLLEPIKVGKEIFERVTIGRVKGRTARLIYEGELADVGRLMDLANALSSPAGAADECLCDEDVGALIAAASRQAGKFLGTDKRGSASLGSSAPDSVSPLPSFSS
jgi:hypothetical protein